MIFNTFSVLICILCQHLSHRPADIYKSVSLLFLSVLLVEETGGHGENHRPVASH